MFLDRVNHFGGTLRDQVKGHLPKTLESLIEVPNVAHVKVHVLSFNVIPISPPYRVLIPSYPFRKDLRHKVKGSPPKMLKILIEVP